MRKGQKKNRKNDEIRLVVLAAALAVLKEMIELAVKIIEIMNK